MSRAPGVHIEYLPSNSLSIPTSASMAVPVLIGPFVPNNETTEACIAIESWQDFVQQFGGSSLTASVLIESILKPEDLGGDKQREGPGEWTYTSTVTVALYPQVEVVRLYFSNGGGRCYIYPLELSDATAGSKRAQNKNTRDNEAALAALSQNIRGIADITLLLWCGGDEKKSIVYDALSELVSDLAAPYFLLTDVKSKTEDPVITANPSVGVWTPHIQIPWPPALPGDGEISVSGYLDNTKLPSEASPTLIKLKQRNITLYEEIKAMLADEYMAVTGTEEEIGRTYSPTPLVAGQICRIDSQRGVWWAPAGMNVVLQGIEGVSEHLSEAEHAVLNEKGINAIRYFNQPTSGFRVFGARTQQPDSDEYRFINVRRLCQMVVRDIGSALQRLVFAPNVAPTWQAARSGITAYLYSLWQQGGLVGSSQENAFFVNVGLGITMSDADILNGMMIVEVGIKASRPAEFIVLRFSQIMDAA